MPYINKKVEITDAEAIALLRKHLAEMPPPEPPEFEVGTAVRLDNGCLGIVCENGSEGEVYVIYLDPDGNIHRPSFGWELTRIEEQD